ncbi:hypothetical protein Q5762_13855 [Streptomyces sp. P9(2023)]|uniref:hypothetical protein n=1 Tax=Streptomyces sp. P9(2023) TaxID=3064394 RepID=UPI0028F41D0A|nr:hypothetical protein [Streptomyces sp. P9(2023)]MDT9689401.1 hypothetical protein [Streptomyces sp. P9(2023)]
MRRTTLTALGAGLLLALTGCGTSDQPAPTVTVTVTVTPTLSAAEQRQACVEAWADTIAARPDDFDPEADTDPDPDACNAIPEADYLDVYMDGLMLSNKRGLDAR